MTGRFVGTTDGELRPVHDERAGLAGDAGRLTIDEGTLTRGIGLGEAAARRPGGEGRLRQIVHLPERGFRAANAPRVRKSVVLFSGSFG
ncbi:MAG: hypothetical protein C4523_17510 [Myxococcales bacterium]|nr:MAG: hypothetical protein C4523_17510 [Myxococcales bacterium]